MLTFFGNPLFNKAPIACDSSITCECPKHGFGISTERADQIVDALYAHAEACFDEQDGKFDFAILVAGPSSLDLLSPAETFYAGFLLSDIHRATLHTIQQKTRAAIDNLNRKLSSLDRKGWTVVSTEAGSDIPPAVRDWLMGFQLGENKSDDDAR